MKFLGFCILVIFQFPFLVLGQKGTDQFRKVGSDFIFSDLLPEDSRKVVMQKLRDGGFLQIYEERDKGLVKCTFRLNDFRYELGAKLTHDKLKFCLSKIEFIISKTTSYLSLY